MGNGETVGFGFHDVEYFGIRAIARRQKPTGCNFLREIFVKVLKNDNLRGIIRKITRDVCAGWKNTLKKEENYEKETYACIGALRLLCF